MLRNVNREQHSLASSAHPVYYFINMTKLAFIVLLLLPALAMANTSKANGKIAFASDRSGNLEIYIMNPDGSNVQKLTNNSAQDIYPVWSPDGKKILFSSDRDGGGLQLYVMNANGTNQVRLTTNDSDDAEANWSPDGKKIVFASDRDVSGSEIYIMDATGANQTRLTLDNVDDEYPSFSPDGTKIIFDSDLTGFTQITTMGVDGSNITPLSSTQNDDQDASFSPNGQQIVFTSYRNTVGQIFVENSDGSNPVQLSIPQPKTDRDAVWSPDGKQIAFVTNRNGSYQIYTMDANGSNQKQLTKLSTNDVQPQWQGLTGSSSCPNTALFWKNHSTIWPKKSLRLGSKNYTQAQLLAIMATPPGTDASLRLADQLIAAQLNIANGSSPDEIRPDITAANRLLTPFTGFLPFHVSPTSTAGKTMVSETQALLRYNTRKLTPSCSP